MKQRLLKIDSADTVAVALDNLAANEELPCEGKSLRVLQPVPAKHKIALRPFAPGDTLTMYGVVVGRAVVPIAPGELIHTQNVEHASLPAQGRTEHARWTAPDVSYWRQRSFLGYHRADGQVGTDNVWLFFPLVFCENKNIEILKDVFENELFPKPVSTYRQHLRALVGGQAKAWTPEARAVVEPEGIKLRFITHQGGCGATRHDALELARLLAGYVHHPNVAGATVLSLGCQNLQVALFEQELTRLDPARSKPLLVFEQQRLGTAEAMLHQAIEQSYAAIVQAAKAERKPAPLSKLVVGLECGGSDGFSGISANPTLGYVSDVLAALRASVVLAEFPELVGVEQNLVNRCVNDHDAARFLELMQRYERQVMAAGSGFHMNPSPGNIKDGLITDAMKSAGAARKGGSSPVEAVLDYGEYVRKPGLNLLCTPGNDVESTTALVGAGTNLVLFTTGLGTPTGNPVAPVLKVSSNSALAERMPDIIDIDTGPVVGGQKSIEEMGTEMLEQMVRVASGLERTKAELAGQNDFIAWRRGVSL